LVIINARAVLLNGEGSKLAKMKPLQKSLNFMVKNGLNQGMSAGGQIGM